MRVVENDATETTDPVHAAKLLAQKLMQLGDGEDKQLFMNALVWAVAGAITSSYKPEFHEPAIQEFSAHLPGCVAAIKRGMNMTRN